MFSYFLYGLALHSEIPLPCTPAIDVARPLVRIGAGDAARFEWLEQRRRSGVSPAWCEYHRTVEGEIGLRWADQFSFTISPDGHDVRFLPAGDVAPDSLFTYLLGQVLSFPLLSFGFEPLHATTVVVDGEAIAFVGDCGYGKSTLAAAFVARGVPVLSDDLLVLEARNGRWIAHPGLPRLKLFPQVARRLLGRETVGVPMNRHTQKLVLPLVHQQAVLQPVPLRALYALSEPDPPSLSASARRARALSASARRARALSASARRARALSGSAKRAPDRPGMLVRIEAVEGAAAFLEVTRAAFNLQVLDAARLANQFAFAKRIATDIPVRRLTYPRSLNMLPAVCDSILADAAQLFTTEM